VIGTISFAAGLQLCAVAAGRNLETLGVGDEF